MKKLSRYSIVLLVLVVTGLTACHNGDKTVEKTGTGNAQPVFKKEGELTFQRGDSTALKIDIEIADNPGEQEQGLMNRSWMEETQGMLFIFDKEQQQQFLMKNTLIPLDIIYVNTAKHIVHVAKNAQPLTETNIPSIEPAQYVIETVAGFCDKFNIKDGDSITWKRI